MSGVQQHVVTPDEEGMRADKWFHKRFPALSHGQLQKLFRTGQIRLDGKRIKANIALEPGQTLRIPPIGDKGSAAGEGAKKPKGRPISQEDQDFIQSLVLHIDEDVIALNKPAGLAVQGGSKTRRHIDGMLDGLKFKASERPRLVHRLDKDTSGVLLLARSRRAAASLGKSLKHHKTQKLYWAFVAGNAGHDKGRINLPLIKKGAPGDERVHPAESWEQGQDAETIYETIEVAASKFSWLAMMPITGRTHQLRVHAAAISLPIIGDNKYGDERAHPMGEIEDKLHLCAREINFPHPRGGMMRVKAPLPPHMAKTWDLFHFDENHAPLEITEEQSD